MEPDLATLAAAFEQAPAMTAIMRGPDHVFVWANAAYRARVGARPLIGLPVAAAIPEVVGHGVLEALDRAHGTGEAVTAAEYDSPLGRDDPRIFHSVYQPLREPGGAVWGVMLQAFDVTGPANARRRAMAERNRLFELTPDLMATADAGRLTDVNPAWTRTLGWSAEELTSRPFLDFVLPEDHAITRAEHERLLTADAPNVFRNRFLAKDGSVRWLEWRSHPLDGVVYAVARDVTEAVGAKDREIAALKEADRMKDQFLGILSHELRTPINAIMGFGSVLDDGLLGPLTERQRPYLHKILDSTDALLALIEDLLTVSRVQAGKFSVRPKPSDLAAIVADVLDSQAPAADRKDVALAAELPGGLPGGLPAALADPHRVRQVVNNLVGNALKFTPPGGTVTVSAARAGEAIRVEVRDTGPGIAPADQGKLFQRFSQLDMSLTRPVGGTGLGLWIVKAIVEAHGGQVGVESEPGAGATFWFTVPVARPAAQ